MSNETREDRRARRAREEETTKATPKAERVIAVYVLVDKPASVSPEGYPIAGGLCALEVAPDAVDVSNPIYKSPASFPWECAAHIQRRMEMRLSEGRK